MRRRDLGLVHGYNHRQDTDGPSSNESTGNEHTDIDGGGLECTSNNSNDGTDLDGPLSTESVGSPTCHEGTKESTGSKERDDGSDHSWGWGVKVIVKLGVGVRNDGTDNTRVVSKEEGSESATYEVRAGSDRVAVERGFGHTQRWQRHS